MAIVKLLMVEDQVNGDDYITNPSWKNIEESLKKIDGTLVTYIGLYKDEEPNNDEFLLVGGGYNGNYICSYYKDGDEHYVINPKETEPDKLIEVPVGQMNIKPKRYYNKLEDIFFTVKYFYETGQMLSSIQWELV